MRQLCISVRPVQSDERVHDADNQTFNSGVIDSLRRRRIQVKYHFDPLSADQG